MPPKDNPFERQIIVLNPRNIFKTDNFVNFTDMV